LQKLLFKAQTGASRSVDISPDGELVAVGLNNGGFVVVTASSFKVWGQKRDRGGIVTAMKYR